MSSLATGCVDPIGQRPDGEADTVRNVIDRTARFEHQRDSSITCPSSGVNSR
jgi:hypothetical protein